MECRCVDFGNNSPARAVAVPAFVADGIRTIRIVEGARSFLPANDVSWWERSRLTVGDHGSAFSKSEFIPLAVLPELIEIWLELCRKKSGDVLASRPKRHR